MPEKRRSISEVAAVPVPTPPSAAISPVMRVATAALVHLGIT
jgi:hypothetical protein